jgi:CRISPR-associated helicase Cas3/CRISPR-associated endonuclease Cas3-HD
MKTYYAHTKEDSITHKLLPKEEWQPLIDHLIEVADLAEKYAKKFGAGRLGRILGLSHDIGKYSDAFQKRLEGSGEKVDHATAGAQQVFKTYSSKLANILAYIVAGHHGGLPDGNKGDPRNLPERLHKSDLPGYGDYLSEVTLPELRPEDLAALPRLQKDTEAFSLQFFIRMLYSCLVDADYSDTEAFMNPAHAELRKQDYSIKDLLPKMKAKEAELKKKGEDNPSQINQTRSDILNQCIAKAASKPGFYTLTVPTGGGKTFSSLAFGFYHADQHNKDRLIYVIPYTSIIEQNAQIFRETLGDEAVLEHHSNFEYPEGNFDEWQDEEKKHRLATENWDKPVIVTTAVQFFESLFASKGSRCRKLHRLTNSVIILDEAQLMPIDKLKPCLYALSELVQNYGATVVFCTATQPSIHHLMPAGTHIEEIMPAPEELQKLFKRVQIKSRGSMTDDTLAHEIKQVNQALIIVNTRKHARLLYDKLAETAPEGLYHLSARMCPKHRKKVLDQVRECLCQKKVCRVVSTQLIEAGVDVDFPRVYRAVAGLDSIAQAAGRCNREGKLRDMGQVMVFEPESHGMPKCFEMVSGHTRGIIRRLPEFGGDLLSLEAIRAYFLDCFGVNEDQLDTLQILSRIKKSMDKASCRPGQVWLQIPFSEIATDFYLIDSSTKSLVVPYDEDAIRIMDRVRRSFFTLQDARLLQPYTVQVYAFELQAMQRENMIEQIGEHLLFLRDESFYSDLFGLRDAREVKIPDSRLLLF